MTPEQRIPLTQRLVDALGELKGLIASRYPDTTFEVGEGEDPDGVYLTATVDVEDMGPVVAVFLDRMVELQVEENLPLFVVAVRSPERNAAILAREQEPTIAALTLP